MGTSRSILFGLGAASLLWVAGGAFAQEGEETSGQAKPLTSLEDRIPPVSGNLFGHKGHLEFSIGLGASFADPFFSKLDVSAWLGYHFAETVSLGLRAAGGLTWVSGYAVSCSSGGCGAESSKFADAPGQIPFLGSLQLSWAPVYGKLNLLAEAVLHFDAYISLGPAVIYSQGSAGGIAVGAVVSIGQRYVVSEHVAVRLEVSDYMYSGGSPQAWLNHQFMFDLGVSFFVL